MLVFYTRMHYFNKFSFLSLNKLKIKWFDCMRTQSARRAGRLQICGSSSFPSLLLFLREQFFPFFFPRVPLGLIHIISPKCTAHYNGITLHEGWIWANAAVRTGYLANVLSRPMSQHKRGIERQRVGGRERGWGELDIKGENTMTNSLLGLKWQECGRWIFWRRQCFDLSRLSQDSTAVSPLRSLSERAGWLAWQPCTAAPTAVRRSTAEPALYQLDWSHLVSLLPPLGWPTWKRV